MPNEELSALVAAERLRPAGTDALDSTIPTTVDATVKAGQVTLTGVATWRYKRDEAEFVAGNVLGVTGVHNEVALATPVPSSADVSQAIKKALESDAKLQASNM